MHYDEFLGQVQHRAHLSSREEAVTAIRATLETFAKRLQRDSADNLASELPKEIGIYLKRAGAHGYYKTERFSPKEFFELVSESEGVDFPKAVHHAQVVLKVLSEAVSKGEMKHVMAALPDEFDALLEEKVIPHAPLH